MVAVFYSIRVHMPFSHDTFGAQFRMPLGRLPLAAQVDVGGLCEG
jgi:hypothetical protein